MQIFTTGKPTCNEVYEKSESISETITKSVMKAETKMAKEKLIEVIKKSPQTEY